VELGTTHYGSVISERRTYGDGCSSAHALDLVGDRWALLIVRDLLFGPKRFSDLQVGLPHGSPNVLTQRLRELESSGIVHRRRLPPPASANVYELTDWGRQLEPILLQLQRWGASSPSYAPDVAVGCDSAMLALKNAFDGAVAGDLAMAVEVRFPLGTFGVTVRNGSINIARGPAESPDVVLETDPPTLEHVAFSALAVDDAERQGELVVHGDHVLAQRFFDLFPVPAASAVPST
jgi:DNA-binding HxlR family transcriptional regulator